MPFLPVSREDMKERRIEQFDFICITGDAYVDHPSFGIAIISRLLESFGCTVGMIAQPVSDADFTRLGRPKYCFMVTGGNFRLFPEDGSVPVSPCGAPLHFLNREGDHFEQAFTDRRASWTYKADRNGDGWLGVWIP